MNATINISIGDIVFIQHEEKIICFRYSARANGNLWGHVITPEGLTPIRAGFPESVKVLDVVKRLEDGKKAWKP